MLLYNTGIWSHFIRFQSAYVWNLVLALAGMVLEGRGIVFCVGCKPLAQRPHACQRPRKAWGRGLSAGEGHLPFMPLHCPTLGRLSKRFRFALLPRSTSQDPPLKCPTHSRHGQAPAASEPSPDAIFPPGGLPSPPMLTSEHTAVLSQVRMKHRTGTLRNIEGKCGKCKRSRVPTG